MSVTRRGFLGLLGGVAATISVPIVAARKANVKWLDVRVRREFETNSMNIYAYYRDCSVPIDERKGYAVGYRIHREHAADLGPVRYRALLKALRTHAAKQVQLAAAGLPSEAYRRHPLECVNYAKIPDNLLERR